MRLNLSAFHYESDDYQVLASSGVSQVLLNAAEVDVDGLEVELEAAVTERLSLFGAATYLKSEFASFPNSPYLVPNPAFISGNHSAVRDAGGNDTPMSPELAVSLGGAYTVPVAHGEFRVTAAYSYNDGYYFDPDNSLEQPSFELLNAGLSYQSNLHWGWSSGAAT